MKTSGIESKPFANTVRCCNGTWPPAKDTTGIPVCSDVNHHPSQNERNDQTMNPKYYSMQQSITDKPNGGNGNVDSPARPGNGLNTQNVILRLIRSLMEKQNEKDAELDRLRKRNDLLEQFAPKGEFGAPNKNGKPKKLIRRGYYTARNGRKPKFPNPDKVGDEQLEFDF